MNKSFWVPLTIHIAIVCLILSDEFPLFHDLHWTPHTSITTIISQLIFFPFADLTYWVVFRKHSIWKGIVAASVAIIFWAILVSILNIVVRSHWDSFFFLLDSNLGDVKVNAYLIGYIIVYSLGRKYIDRLFRLKEIQIQRTKNALDALKAQLNPHFFFNSLNYLYGTALSEKASRTSKSIEVLSDMMRYTLSGANEDLVALTDEVEFVKNYIYLQKVRFPETESIQIEVEIDDYEGTKKIAPMLFLPFIENAFKYGISIDHPCYVYISIKISEGDLSMKIKNSINDYAAPKGNNTGIINTRKRLDLLYPNKYMLKCENTGLAYNAILSVKL